MLKVVKSMKNYLQNQTHTILHKTIEILNLQRITFTPFTKQQASITNPTKLSQFTFDERTTNT